MAAIRAIRIMIGKYWQSLLSCQIRNNVIYILKTRFPDDACDLLQNIDNKINIKLVIACKGFDADEEGGDAQYVWQDQKSPRAQIPLFTWQGGLEGSRQRHECSNYFSPSCL